MLLLLLYKQDDVFLIAFSFQALLELSFSLILYIVILCSCCCTSARCLREYMLLTYSVYIKDLLLLIA